MSPVTEKKPHSNFICKNFDLFVREGGPARLPRFLGNRDENFPRQPCELDENLKKKIKISFAFATVLPKYHNFALYALPLQMYSN